MLSVSLIKNLMMIIISKPPYSLSVQHAKRQQP